MIENDTLSLVSNDKGEIFYKKWKNDTKNSVFIMAPISVFFLLGCFTMIVGVSIKLFFISLPPIIIIILTFIYVPFFVRRRYINNLVNTIKIENGIVALTTYEWFTYKPIIVFLQKKEMEIKVTKSESFFTEKTVILLKSNNVEGNTFFLIEEFFDSNNRLQQLLN